jgi:hypothetical protein
MKSNLLLNNDFSYLIGNFLADGSLYESGRGLRFEFVDGSPYKNELGYCFKHMTRIKKILQNFLNKQLPPIRKKGNKYILKFRSKELAKIFVEVFKFSPGKKHRIIDIPQLYKDSKYEKDFWIGFLDGDGSVARKFRKISVESMSNNIINSFADYLTKNNIFFSRYKSKRRGTFSYVIVIRSVSFRNFVDKIGFSHPLKSQLLLQKLDDQDFFVDNQLKKDVVINGLIDYTLLFDGKIFIENGKKILRKYGYSKYTRDNIKFLDVFNFLKNQGQSNENILKEINKMRFKKSKGSINSIKLPLSFTGDLLRISKYIRIKPGGITFSKRYILSFNENYDEILNITEKIFDIKPKFTSKKEPIFCSGVLSDFFTKIIKRQNYIG